MKLQNQQGKPQCTIYAAAMVLGIPADQIIKELGHDGLEVWWTAEQGNRRLRGVHFQELIDIFWHHGYALIPIELHPQLAPGPMPFGRRIFDLDQGEKQLGPQLPDDIDELLQHS